MRLIKKVLLHLMAGEEGFEPTTRGFGIRCSTVGATRLKYTTAHKGSCFKNYNNFKSLLRDDFRNNACADCTATLANCEA